MECATQDEHEWLLAINGCLSEEVHISGNAYEYEMTGEEILEFVSRTLRNEQQFSATREAYGLDRASTQPRSTGEKKPHKVEQARAVEVEPEPEPDRRKKEVKADEKRGGSPGGKGRTSGGKGGGKFRNSDTPIRRGPKDAPKPPTDEGKARPTSPMKSSPDSSVCYTCRENGREHAHAYWKCPYWLESRHAKSKKEEATSSKPRDGPPKAEVPPARPQGSQ